MSIPTDPYMLLSFINMKLRDYYSGGLEDLCDDLDIDKEELTRILADAGFEYDSETNRFV